MNETVCLVCQALTLKYNVRFGMMAAALKLTGRKRLATLITKSWSVSVLLPLIIRCDIHPAGL